MLKMTKEDLIKKLEYIAKPKLSSDTEVDHIDADNLILEYINDNDIAEAYNNIRKWYA